jgi:hypothetical protein
MPETTKKPSFRKPFGVLAIIAWIIVWSIIVLTAFEFVSGWPVLVQAPFYLIAGIGWIVPLKPVLRWMEAG